MDIAGLPMMRRPFSPISSTDSSRSNATNVLDELNRKQQQHSEMVQKTLSTPVKTIPIPNPNVEEENRTPMAMPIPIPSTPSTVSIPMQTAITPAPLSVVPYNAAKAMEETGEEIEYSFEERRAGFVVPRTHIKTLMLV